MCPILKGFRDRGIWLYSGLAWAPSIVLLSRRAAPLSEACESVWNVSWLLWLLIVTLLECCEKCRTTSQMPNMLIWCMLMASAMVVPLLLLKNTVDGFLCAEFRIVDCFKRCSIHCVNAVRFPVLMVRLKGHVNKTWRNRKTFLIWYSVTLLLAREDFQHVSVFHENVYGEHCMKTACTFSPTACAKSTPVGQCHASRILSLVTYKSQIASINTIHW